MKSFHPQNQTQQYYYPQNRSDFKKEHIDFLVEKGVKAVVVACNTATSAAIELLRERYPDMPIVGIEPALKPAVLFKENARVLVMATPMTIREEKFHHLMEHYENQATIYPLSCPGLPEFVEAGNLDGADLEAYLKNLFSPYLGKTDAVVLGCTHYPFVRPMIQKIFGDRVALFDGGAGTARELRRRMREYDILNTAQEKGSITILNSNDTPDEIALSEKLLYL